jgi:hypothetical protein
LLFLAESYEMKVNDEPSRKMCSGRLHRPRCSLPGTSTLADARAHLLEDAGTEATLAGRGRVAQGGRARRAVSDAGRLSAYGVIYGRDDIRQPPAAAKAKKQDAGRIGGKATMNFVWIYTNTSKQVGDREHVKVFADADSADAWFKLHDPEGVAFEYPVIRNQPGPPPLQPT